MFGSTNPFGQSSSSPFGSQSVFGQASNTGTNPFAPKPFGSTTPFGSQTGVGIFGGTSTGAFGAPQSSNTPFGGSAPAFGASSTPAFGSSSAPFGGSSVFSQKPAFGFSTTQSSPFGSTTQQSQPAFGSGFFGSSTPFGASSTPAFGASSTPAFGAGSTPAFGAGSTPAFGATSTSAFGASSTPAFGSAGPGFGMSGTSVFGSGGAFGASSTPGFGPSSTPAFGASSTPAFGASSTPAFGASSTPAFGASSAPAFGASSNPPFGASSNPAFGASSNPAFGASSNPAFGASNNPAFGASSTPSFSFGSAPAFGQSSSAFGSAPFGSTSSPFGGQSSPFGAQASTPTFGSTGFGQTSFGGQQGGSRIAPYAPTTEADTGSSTQPAGKLESISAMPIYKDKSHEELRWEDYQRGDKGGPAPTGQSPSGVGFGSSTAAANPFAPSPAFGQSSANLFSSSTASNPFAPRTPTFGSSGFGTSTTPAFGSSPFGTTSSSNVFGSTSSTTSPLFGTAAFGSGSSSPLFGSSSTPAFGSSPSLFGTTSSQGTTTAFGPGFGFGASQTSPLFSSSASAMGQTGSAFGQTTSSFGQSGALTFGQSSAPSFGQTSIFNTPSMGFGSLFTSSSSLNTSSSPLFGSTVPAASTPFQPVQPAQTSSSFGFANQTSFGSGSAMFGQSTFAQSSPPQSSVVLQPVAVTNPFGTLPAMPQMSIGGARSAPSIQYGISNMPVVDKPAPVRISSILTSRHLSQRRTRLPVRKYRPSSDRPKIAFFSDDEESSGAPKADAHFIPRENPRLLVIRPTEDWPMTVSTDRSLPSLLVHGSEDDVGKEPNQFGKTSRKANGVQEDSQKQDSYKTLSGHRAGEAAIVYEHGADIEALMPKLRRSDYYTEPRIQELAAKERADPGFCRRVKDFVVGRHGYGSIKFLGETDVRRLDLESLVQFNDREVIVYMDDSKKPPIGQGLNKPAEVTLLNIKCIDKKSGRQYTEGPKIEKYKEMLKRRAEEQGAEFASYDPIKGEWKFRVDHFSGYKLGDEEQSDLCDGFGCC